jgi:hypothetical protein
MTVLETTMTVLYRVYINGKKVTFTLKRVMEVQRGSKVIALHFLETRHLMGWVVNVTGLLAAGSDPVPIVQDTRWVPGPIWMGAQNLAPHRNSNPEPSRP